VEAPEEAQEDVNLEFIGGMQREDAVTVTDAKKSRNERGQK
jgi:hypothetical protein